MDALSYDTTSQRWEKALAHSPRRVSNLSWASTLIVSFWCSFERHLPRWWVLSNPDFGKHFALGGYILEVWRYYYIFIMILSLQMATEFNYLICLILIDVLQAVHKTLSYGYTTIWHYIHIASATGYKIYWKEKCHQLEL